VTVDFPAAVAAETFAMRFDGVDQLLPQATLPESLHQSPT